MGWLRRLASPAIRAPKQKGCSRIGVHGRSTGILGG